LRDEEAEVSARLARLLARSAVTQQTLDDTRADYAARAQALGHLRLVLDSACVFISD
jgi:hypothetical protein